MDFEINVKLIGYAKLIRAEKCFYFKAPLDKQRKMFREDAQRDQGAREYYLRDKGDGTRSGLE